MNATTSANPTTSAQTATVPGIRLLQMDPAGIGRIAGSVNLFRGDVLLPLELLSLTSRGGLEVKVAVSYQSNTVHNVNTWNVEAPTGILGLGWSMSYDAIIADHGDSISPFATTFYLVDSNGGQTRLYLKSRTATEWIFEMESYRFWDIRFFPAESIWQIQTESGTVKRYGEEENARELGVLWGGSKGNWTDSSVQAGQSRFDTGWGLSSIQNLFGDKLQFEYDNVDLTIGPAGNLRYTRASYLAAINDPSGRRVTFSYGEKVYNEAIREYENPHIDAADRKLVAYQDRFQTRFLKSITVSDETGPSARTYMSLRFEYSLAKVSPAVGEARYLYKRYLRSINVVDRDGAVRPGLTFNYSGVDTTPTSANPGALATVTYPEGGQALYEYGVKQLAGTALRRELKQSDTGAGVPRVWFGSDYTVISRYDDRNGRLLTVNVYDWNGRWIGSQPLRVNLPGTLDLDTLTVQSRGDWFLLSGRTSGQASGPALHAYAFNRKFGRFGDWEVTPLQMPSLALSTEYAIVAGEEFVAAAASLQRGIIRYRWDIRARQWISNTLILPTAGAYSMGVYDSYFTLATYFKTTNQVSLSLQHLDNVSGAWSNTNLDSFGPVLWKEDFPKLSWSNSGSLAVATYLISEDPNQETVTYGVRLYTWNREFQQVVRTDLPVETRKRSSLEPFVFSFASRSLVGNVGRLRRYNGNAWVAGSLGSFDSGQQPAGFAYADDLALGANDNSARAVSYDPYSGNFLPQVTIQGQGGPIQPTISGRYVTVRRNIFYRDPKGALIQVGTLPAGADQVANHGPFYFAYQLSTGESFVHLMTNGVLAPSAVRITERMFPTERGSGTILTSLNAFAAYTGASFDTATTIVLYRLLFGEFKGDITGRVVTAATVVDNMGQPLRTGFDYPGEATTGVYGLVNQFSRSRSTVGNGSAESAPDGYTETDFYNGLSQSSIGAAEPYALLSGIEKAKRFFNSANELVQEESYNWVAVSSIKNIATGESENLFGAYTRRERVVSRTYAPGTATPGPLERIQESEYDPALGLIKTSRTHSFNSEDKLETIEEHNKFAYEEYPELLAAHVWSPVIEKRTTVDGSPIEIQTTTWRRDWGAVTGWAPFRLYRARSQDAVFTALDWANTTVANPAAWWLYDEILVRDQFGNILERKNETHQTSAWIFDARGRFAVAQFPDSTLGEVLYLGFEPYEAIAPWLLGGSEARLRAAIVTGDAHTGSNALRLTGPDALTATTAIPSPDGRTVALSYWYKTRTQNAGRWTISANGVELAAQLVGETQGAWRFSHLLATLPLGTSTVSVEVRFTPANGADLLIDDIRFSPAESACEATIYNPLSLQPAAKVQASGATTRNLYSGFGLPALEVAPGEAVTAVSGRYLSRLSNGGVFDQSAPNATIQLHPQSWGFYQSFTIGEEWRNGWVSATPADWNAREGKLHHSGAASRITFERQPEARYYGASVQLSAVGALSGPVGFVFGNDLSLTWDPRRATWNFGSIFQPPRSALNVSWSAYHTSLDAGRLPDTFPEVFGAAGLPLAADAVVTKLLEQSAWTITDPAGTVYYLARDPFVTERICVVLAPRSLVLTIRGAEIILFADGGQAFSMVHDSTVTGPIGLTASGEVDFANVAFFNDPQSEWNYQDGAGRNVQFQVADESGFIASATIYDAAGRAAIATLPARLAPAPGKLATYEPNLATFDWTTFTMSGVVVTQHPDAGGYPYTRTRYENSPLAREVQRGIPGSDFAIIGAAGNVHTTSTHYGINDATLGLTAGRYFSQTIIDPDGITRVTLTDQRGAVVRTAALAARAPERWDVTIYLRDAALNLVSMVTPMGYPVDSTYDFLNATLTQRSADFTLSRRLYDSVGRLRFEMSGDGAAAVPQYVRFYKYDRQSRIAQQGSFPHAWDNQLNEHVDDPTWPTAVPSDSFHYDGFDRADLLGVGRLTATTSERQVSTAEQVDSFRADQSFFYDERGRTVRISARADDFRQTTYELTQRYNNLDGIVEIQTPSFTGAAGERIGKAYDLVGRLTEVSLDDAPLVRYGYDLSGQASRETWLHNGVSVGGRNLKYNPPGWNTFVDGTGFQEGVDYASGGVGGVGCFNGSPARITTAPRGSNGEIVSQYSYDVLGRLNQALVQNNSTTFAYDANGNITQLGSTTLVYEGSDQVTTANDQGQSEAYEYDNDGNLKRATGALALELSFDWFRGLPLRASRTIGGETVAVDFRYGFRGRRIYRKVTRPGVPDESILYLRGDGPDPLVEFTSAGRKTIQILGPRGLSVLKIQNEAFFVSTDRLGSVRALVDSSGSLVAGYDFTPYGSLLGAPLGQGELTTYRFTGRQLDPSGLYDFRARFYDARLGRFISPDPKMQFPSPYSYAAGSPLLLTDPSGEFIELLIAAIVAAIAEIIETIVTAVIVGAAVGALVGGVQAVVTIAENGLTGGQAAGVFFGFLGLGAVAGAITGFAGGVVGVATSTVAASVTAGSITGAVVGAATGAAVGAGQSALLGADSRAGAAFGALGGAVSGAVGSFLGGFGKLASVQASVGAQNTLSLVSGTTAGASGNLLSAVAQGKDANDTLLLTLKGAAYGFLGRVVRLKPPAPPEPPRVAPSNAPSRSSSQSSLSQDEDVI
ncbi:MAG TPA: RHS repeat-associated core domain-containing protein [Pyrinomonadaceae bacterium]|nr:RHS repeat-associated core domain-containing protein [Pyrinomonadaceae bacterium]